LQKWKIVCIFASEKQINKMNTLSMNNLWNYLQGLSLTASNQRWLAERLLESSEKGSATKEDTMKKLVFPKIGKDFKVSQEVLDMVCGSLPEDFDLDKEKEVMWEEMAQ
jgi:hypothetical protein